MATIIRISVDLRITVFGDESIIRFKFFHFWTKMRMVFLLKLLHNFYMLYHYLVFLQYFPNIRNKETNIFSLIRFYDANWSLKNSWFIQKILSQVVYILYELFIRQLQDNFQFTVIRNPFYYFVLKLNHLLII